MENRKNSVLAFLKKNLFYLILAVVMLVLTGVGIALLVKQNSAGGVYVDKTSASEDNFESDSPSTSESTSSSEQVDNPSPPVETVIVFTMPVVGGEIQNAYTADTVVFNPTLGAYTGHMGVDIFAGEDASVVCAYEGSVESIVTDYLNGTVVTINHGKGLKTVYSSIEVDENLKKGQKLQKGDKIGTVSIANKQEYKSGPHLHFEVYENGIRIDPEEYLPSEDK